MLSSRSGVRICLLAFMSAAAAFGQSQLSYRASIPFQFGTGRGATMPAGTYTIAYSPGAGTVMLSGGAKDRTLLPVITRLAGQAKFGDANLVFDESGSTPVLSEIWLPGQDGILVSSSRGNHSHRSVMAVVSGGGRGSGKEIFSRTCASCHGPKGNGNPAADKFFNASIPRLVSPEVQAKSDAELREIITQGRRSMDPVRIGQAGVKHLLQPESVDQVIAHVRTLKP